MCQYDDPCVLVLLFQICLQPLNLLFTDSGHWIRDIVENDEMNTIVIECVVEIAEELLVSVAAVQRGVMLSCHETHGLHFELTDDVTELRHALPAYPSIVGGLGEIAGEDDEIRLFIERIDGRNRLLQCSLGIRIDGRSVEPPMRVGELNKIEGIIFFPL